MPVHYERRGPIATFTFDNGKVNALTPQMHKELYHHLQAFLRDRELRVGILTGAEGKCFSAGDDIKTPMPPRTEAEELEAHLNPHGGEGDTPGRPGWDVDILMLPRYKPIVGAVRSWCLGQALMYLLLHTDVRIAGESARLGFPEIAYGMGGAGGTTRLGRQIPHTAAMWMLLTGDLVDAQEALRTNLVNRVVPDDQLMAVAIETAEKIARHPPLAVRIEMEAYYRGIDMARQDAVINAGHLYRLQRLGYEGYGAESGFFGKKAPRS